MLDPQLIKALRAQLEALKAQFYTMEAELEQRAREAAERHRKKADRTAEQRGNIEAQKGPEAPLLHGGLPGGCHPHPNTLAGAKLLMERGLC